ncbi:MAG: glycosyltransferase [Thermoguttaceae bacterium]
MTPIPIALCITELDLGGAERCLTELAVRMDRRRFTPTVYCLGPQPTDAQNSCLPRLEAAGVPTYCLGGHAPWQFPAIVRRLKRLLLSKKPQIAQTFLFHANVVGRIASRRAGVPIVVSGIRVAEHQAAWHLWLDRWTESWADRYVCVSQSVADFSSTRGGIPAEKLVVIPNGVDPDVFPAKTPVDLATLGIAPGRRLATFIGRLEPQKGVDWLLNTAKTWLSQLPDCDLLVVGEGPLRPKLEAICRNLRLTDRVHLVGRRTDVPAILAASQLLVLPSRWEGMPNVVLEAMASSLPVVATQVEGVAELLGPLSDRQLVAQGDSQAWTARIADFLLHPDVAAAVGQENRRRVEQNFTISRIVAAYEDLWQRLAESQNTQA